MPFHSRVLKINEWINKSSTWQIHFYFSTRNADVTASSPSPLLLQSSVLPLPTKWPHTCAERTPAAGRVCLLQVGLLSSLVMPRGPDSLDGLVDTCDVLQLCGLPTCTKKLLSANVRLCLPKNNVTKITFRCFLTNSSVTVTTMMRTHQDDESGGSLTGHLGTKVPF